MVYQYTTHELVQAELRASASFSTSTDPSYDDVDEWISEESAYINSLANQVFGSTLYPSEYIDYNGEETLVLENAPIISVVSVEYNANPVGSSLGSSWVTKTEGTDFIVYKDRGTIQILPNWSPSDGSQRIRITYSAGYSEIPYQVRKLATKLVTERVLSTLISQNIQERNDGGTVSIGSVSITEPASYGVQSYRKLKDDIENLKEELIKKQFSVYRFAHI